jgi:hypothetical protein
LAQASYTEHNGISCCFALLMNYITHVVTTIELDRIKQPKFPKQLFWEPLGFLLETAEPMDSAELYSFASENPGICLFLQKYDSPDIVCWIRLAKLQPCCIPLPQGKKMHPFGYRAPDIDLKTLNQLPTQPLPGRTWTRVLPGSRPPGLPGPKWLHYMKNSPPGLLRRWVLPPKRLLNMGFLQDVVFLNNVEFSGSYPFSMHDDNKQYPPLWLEQDA